MMSADDFRNGLLTHFEELERALTETLRSIGSGVIVSLGKDDYRVTFGRKAEGFV
jgi:hypothetical protein